MGAGNRRKSEPTPKIPAQSEETTTEALPNDAAISPGTLDPATQDSPAKSDAALKEGTPEEGVETTLLIGKGAKGGKGAVEVGLLGLPILGSKSAKEQEKADKAAKAEKVKEEARLKREQKKKENEAAKIEAALKKATSPPPLVAPTTKSPLSLSAYPTVRATISVADRLAISKEVANMVVAKLDTLIDGKITRAVQQSVKSARLPLNVDDLAGAVAKKVSTSLPPRQEAIIPGLKEYVDSNLNLLNDVAHKIEGHSASCADASKFLQKEASKTLAFSLKVDDIRTVLDHLVEQNKRQHASALTPPQAHPQMTGALEQAPKQQPKQQVFGTMELPNDTLPKRRRELSEEPRQAEFKLAKRGLGAFETDDDYRSRNVPEDRILWVRAFGEVFLPTPAVAADLLARAGIPLDYLTPDGGFIAGWVAVGNNETSGEWTKSYRVVFTSAIAKTVVQREAQKLKKELQNLDMKVSDWEWRDDATENSYERAALKASDDCSRALELAYSNAEGFDGAQSFKSLNNKVAEARSYHSAVQRRGRGGYRGRGASNRGSYRPGRSGGRYN